MTEMRQKSPGMYPRLVTDSFSKPSEYYVTDTILGTKDTLVNKGDQLPPLGEHPVQMGEWKAKGKASSKLNKQPK